MTGRGGLGSQHVICIKKCGRAFCLSALLITQRAIQYRAEGWVMWHHCSEICVCITGRDNNRGDLHLLGKVYSTIDYRNATIAASSRRLSERPSSKVCHLFIFKKLLLPKKLIDSFTPHLTEAVEREKEVSYKGVNRKRGGAGGKEKLRIATTAQTQCQKCFLSWKLLPAGSPWSITSPPPYLLHS